MRLFAFLLTGILLLFIFMEIISVFSPIQVKETIIEIHNGESASSIANKLYKNNIIKSPFVFKLCVKIKDIDKQLSHGKYLFSGHLNVNDVINNLLKGKVILKKITIPEGLTIKKTARAFSREGMVNESIFLKLANDSTIVKKLTGFDLPSLEGFLYPETYFFPEEASEFYIIETMIKEFFKKTRYCDFKTPYNLTFYETLILASIVEKEAKINSEKPKISSVYLNRLEINQKLQADPTVAYVIEKLGKSRKKIYYKDLLIESPFNTYLYPGLPPAPICSPSISTINAVLNPLDTPYFYFFANKKGFHIFSETYNQHLRKQRELKASYGT